MKRSAHKALMAELCGPAFAHYVRTDRSGGRPLPEALRAEFLRRGWLTDAPPCDCPEGLPGLVLDPFAGSGTVLAVAVGLGLRAIGCDLNPEYVALCERRLDGVTPDMFAGV